MGRTVGKITAGAGSGSDICIADKKRKNANEYEMVFHSVFGGIFLFVQLYVVRGMSKIVK